MIAAHPAGSAHGAVRDDAGAAAAHGVAEWLGLAAAPAFATMALLTGVLGGGPINALCAAEHGSPLHGMAQMYLLMAAFHSPPWLRMISGRRRAPKGHAAPRRRPGPARAEAGG